MYMNYSEKYIIYNSTIATMQAEFLHTPKLYNYRLHEKSPH